MSRLFISLFLYILVALTGFYLAVEFLPERILGNSIQAYQKSIYQGTAYLLDQRMLDTPDEQAELKAIQAAFGYDVEFKSLNDINIEQENLKQLQEGEIFVKEIDAADYLYYPSVLPGKVWVLQTEQHQTEDYQRSANGTIHLIENVLRPYSLQQRPIELAKLAKYFGFDVSLKPLAELDLPEDLEARVLNGELISQFYDSDNEQYYSRLFDSDYFIHAGPLRNLWAEKYLIYTIFALLAFLIAMAIYIWVLPLWRSLLALDHAATQLGEGDFDTRVESRGFTPIKKINRSFNLMAQHIQNLVVSHKDLTNAVSHELRTPLARLRFGLEMMQTAEDESKRERYFKEMNTDIEELEALISELLTYARIERDRHTISYQQCELLPWLEEQTQRLSTLTKDKKLVTNFKSLTHEDRAQVEPKLMARALSNLVTNAIRHAQSVILVSASIEGHELRITVDDDGGGISPDIGPAIFEPFKRGDISRDRDSGGFGLGLGIVKQIVDWHKGNVNLRQSDLGGARFVMTVPIKKSQI